MRLSMPLDQFVIVARAASELAAKDATRAALAMVRFVGEDQQLRVESTNAYVLGRWDYEDDYVLEPGDLRIMRSTLTQIIKHTTAIPAPLRKLGTIDIRTTTLNRADVTVTPAGDSDQLDLRDVRLFDGTLPNRSITSILSEYMYRGPETIDKLTKAQLVETIANASWQTIQQTVHRIVEADHASTRKNASELADQWVAKLVAAVGDRKGEDLRDVVRRWVNRHLSADALRDDLAAQMAGKAPGLHSDMAFNPEYVKAIVKAAEPITDGHIPLRYYSDNGVKPLHVWATRIGVGRFDGLIMPVRV